MRMLRYLAVSFQTGLRGIMVFRLNFFMEYIMIFLRIGMMLALWAALYIGQESVEGISLATMQFYTVASILFELFISANTEKAVTEMMRDGSIAMVLTRPVAFPLSLTVDRIALTAQNLVVRIVPYTIFLLASGIAFKAQVHFSPAFILSAFLSYVIMLLYQMFFGFISFWTIEIAGFLEARDAAMLVFSGSMIPLWFFPDWLFNIAAYLPFQAIYSTPLSILIGKISGGDVLPALSVQLLWLAAFAGLTVLFWSKARRRVIVNGG